MDYARIDPFEAVLEFHRAFGVGVGTSPSSPSSEVIALRRTLMEEELGETIEAMSSGDLVAVADGLADLLYVVYGTAIAYGMDIRPIFAEVHRSNMTKVGGRTRGDGKVLKPDGWAPPNLAPILRSMKL